MKRTSTTIDIETPSENPNFPTITRLPWVNNVPDFTGIEEPTLSVLINSWNVFLESGEQLEVVADPNPTLIVNPRNWQNFGGVILQNTLYEKYKSNPDFLVLASFVATLANQDNPSLYQAFGAVWDKFTKSSGGLLDEEIQQVNQVCVACNMPFSIGSDSLIIFG